MKSNDKIPRDEMLLAEALAAARALKLKFCTGAPFRSFGGQAISPRQDPDLHGLAKVCALGALWLAGKVRDIDNEPKHLYGVTDGNDMGGDWNQYASGDYGESLGWAFRCAMTK